MEDRPKLVELDAPGHYTLPMAKALVGLLPPQGEAKASIRLDLGNAIVLDIPLSEASLVALSHDLTPVLPRRVQQLPKGKWFWVVVCERCKRPIPLFPAPNPRSIPATPDDPFYGQCLHLDCNHRGKYQNSQIRREFVKPGG